MIWLAVIQGMMAAYFPNEPSAQQSVVRNDNSKKNGDENREAMPIQFNEIVRRVFLGSLRGALLAGPELLFYEFEIIGIASPEYLTVVCKCNRSLLEKGGTMEMELRKGQ